MLPSPLTGTLANNEDPYEMLQFSAFHQGLLCLIRLKQYSGTEVHLNLEILTRDALICSMNHTRLIVLNQMDEFISKQRGELTAASLLSTWLVVAAMIKQASASCTLKHGTQNRIRDNL